MKIKKQIYTFAFKSIAPFYVKIKNMKKQLFQDMLDRTVEIPFPPQRIISLVPSITETLFELGLEKKIVGITDYCIHPKEKIKEATKIGGTKNPNIDLISTLKPDLIIADKNENTQSQVEKLMKIAPVFVMDVNNYEEALSMILLLGIISNCKKKAEDMVSAIRHSFQNLPRLDFSKTVFFPIWKGPCMTINKDTYIHSMIEKLGLINTFANKQNHYPKVGDKELEVLNPDFVFLPSEPCSYTPEDVVYCKSLFPNAKVIEVDGQMFAWYGARLLAASFYLHKLLFQITSTH